MGTPPTGERRHEAEEEGAERTDPGERGGTDLGGEVVGGAQHAEAGQGAQAQPGGDAGKREGFGDFIGGVGGADAAQIDEAGDTEDADEHAEQTVPDQHLAGEADGAFDGERVEDDGGETAGVGNRVEEVGDGFAFAAEPAVQQRARAEKQDGGRER